MTCKKYCVWHTGTHESLTPSGFAHDSSSRQLEKEKHAKKSNALIFTDGQWLAKLEEAGGEQDLRSGMRAPWLRLSNGGYSSALSKN